MGINNVRTFSIPFSAYPDYTPLIACSTGLPGVIPGFPADGSTAIVDVFFWTPQVIGGSGFIVSSLLLMVEVQKRWWRPNLTSLGWYALFPPLPTPN